MAIRIDVKDHSGQTIRATDEAIHRALTAVGTEAVGMVMTGMDTLYYRRIWRTGDLHRSIAYAVDGSSVHVGTNIEYAHFVHDGTYRMRARPFLRDTLTSSANLDRLGQIASAYLAEAMEKKK